MTNSKVLPYVLLKYSASLPAISSPEASCIIEALDFRPNDSSIHFSSSSVVFVPPPILPSFFQLFTSAHPWLALSFYVYF
ncbi:hypothetical protein Y032_0011g1238 [Ancylostoma ceylanicum]|uniref:Uncharacterized protein n=1 Tax=Ancylostoma ceylanicum TaxID=53326 RepID=A0A016VDK7_9BILA|nr:hypothetical protein Y032_0011g1238 [Ancylostoma ceylanicum]